jgi:hypothetical protein
VSFGALGVRRSAEREGGKRAIQQTPTIKRLLDRSLPASPKRSRFGFAAADHDSFWMLWWNARDARGQACAPFEP